MILARLSMRLHVVLLTAGISVGLLGGCQPYPAHQREIAVEVHEGTNLSFDLSPDGRWIVLDLVGQLWTLPAGGGEAVALTDAVRDSTEAHDPRWSPDGTRVVFWRGFDRTSGVSPLWVLAVDSGGSRALVADTVQYRDPAWHPSGRSLLVVHSTSRTRPDDHLYLYDLTTGALSPVPADGLPANAAHRLATPAWSPDGQTIAVVDGGALGPIWEVDVANGAAVRVTADTAQGPTNSVGRVAWTRDGRNLVFVRSGRLWSVSREGGTPTEIPFTATVRFVQERPALPPLRFPAPGSNQRAHGFTGIALAPDADRVALIALDSLWIITLDGEATGIAHVRQNAKGISWSPDGRTLAWSGGPKGEEGLFATDIASGATRALTALPGQELRPAWSPDGRRLAFLHTGPEIRGAETRLRVLATEGVVVERPDQTTDLGPALGVYGLTPLDMAPQWSGDGSAVLVALPGGEVLVVPLEGDRRTLRLPVAASAVRRIGQDSVVYLLEDQLYVARLRSDSTAIAEGRLVTEDAALYPAVARDGTVLYVSTDGLRVRSPGGSTTRLGWPVRFRTPSPPLAHGHPQRATGRTAGCRGGASGHRCRERTDRGDHPGWPGSRCAWHRGRRRRGPVRHPRLDRSAPASRERGPAQGHALLRGHHLARHGQLHRHYGSLARRGIGWCDAGAPHRRGRLPVLSGVRRVWRQVVPVHRV